MQAIRAIIDPLNLLDKQDRFKQLSLAVHNYASANNVLPLVRPHVEPTAVAT